MHGGIAGHGGKVLQSRDPAEHELACSITMPFPEMNFPVREPKHELAVHLRFMLKTGESRQVQKRFKHRVAAAGISVPAKKNIDRSLAQLFMRSI